MTDILTGEVPLHACFRRSINHICNCLNLGVVGFEEMLVLSTSFFAKFDDVDSQN